MSDPEIMKEFFDRYLPTDIKDMLNFETIVQRKNSYVNEDLKNQEVDLLFSAEFNDKPGYLYLLLESQVMPDRFMAFRILKYMIAIMDDHLKKNKKGPLPIVIPFFVLYSGWRNITTLRTYLTYPRRIRKCPGIFSGNHLV
jgi:predicted transposase/invertase (TIGR01784 family)